MKAFPIISVTFALSAMVVAAPSIAPLEIKSAAASSNLKGHPPSQAIDGKTSEESRWVSIKSEDPAWLVIDLGKVSKVAGLHIYSGGLHQQGLSNFKVQFRSDEKWIDIPSAEVSNSKAKAIAIAFDQTLAVETRELRIWITDGSDGTAIVREILVWPAASGDFPPLQHEADSDEQIPLIYLNQSGFNLGKPKRFTAPTLADGTEFVVHPVRDGTALVARGTIKNHIGDFTSSNPTGNEEYVVEAGGITSVPFRIGQWWLERITYQNAVNFMIDSRHYVGNERARCGGSYGWRDDHHFGWELHTLVPQFLSNPSAYERMPHQVRYEAPKDKNLWGTLEPYHEDAPDIVKLIHWGADCIITQKLGHEMLKAQLAYFLYAWPVLESYCPRQNYEAALDYAFSTWADPDRDRKYPYDESPQNNLLALKTKLGSTKGCLPPGFSIEPNLLMYEVAKREERPDAEIYFDAAFNQVVWMIANLDWSDPLVTKGQRMSEFITMTGMAHFLCEYPDRAPEGLLEKINEWAKVIVRRSDNLWDFRKLDDKDGWTPTGDTPQKWNEPGNVAGLPAAILAARPFVTDPATRQRLDEIVWSHFDDMFGRNPVGRHFSYDAPREVEGVEHGWFKFHVGGIGRLADARFVLDGSPKNGHYPYHPEVGDIGWTEGWVQFNTAFNASLAYLAWSDSQIELVKEGDELVIHLVAPLDFDYGKVESGTVTVASDLGDQETVTVTEDAKNSPVLTGRIKLRPSTSAVKEDQRLQFKSDASIQARYGYGYLGTRGKLRP